MQHEHWSKIMTSSTIIDCISSKSFWESQYHNLMSLKLSPTSEKHSKRKSSGQLQTLDQLCSGELWRRQQKKRWNYEKHTCLIWFYLMILTFIYTLSRLCSHWVGLSTYKNFLASHKLPHLYPNLGLLLFLWPSLMPRWEFNDAWQLYHMIEASMSLNRSLVANEYSLMLAQLKLFTW